ncbi:MAG: hypothetical protein PHE61_03490 [Candidatus Omnitrophica bacterium]|nr:hypothetical protein [Candidatus Omnitrophota bacterium]
MKSTRGWEWQRDGIFILLIFVLLIIFYPQFFLAKGAFLTADHEEQHFPWAFLFSENIKQGIIPFWTSGIQCGFPIAAEGQIGVFYPPNLLFYLLLPIKVAYAYLTLFHFLIAGLGMYIYARRNVIGHLASFLAAVLFLFGTASGGGFYNVNSLKTLCWFPLALYCADNLTEKQRLRDALALGVVCGLSLLAGYLQLAVYFVGFSMLYLALRVAFSAPPRQRTAFFLKVSAFAAAALFCAFIISAWQLVLTWRLSLFSNRIVATESFAYIGSFSPLAFVTLIYPDLSGVFRGNVFYMGALSLFFALLIPLKPWRSKLYLIMFGISVFLALGQFNPLYVLFVKLTRFYSFRVPFKFMFFAGFFLSLIAGLGLDNFLSSLKGLETRLKRAFRILAGFFVVSFTGLAAAHWSAKIFYEPLYSLGQAYVRRFIYMNPSHPRSLEEYYQALRRLMSFFIASSNLLKPQLVASTIIVLAVFFLISLCLRGVITRKAFLCVGIPLLLIDLYYYGFLDIKRDFSSYERVLQPPAVCEYLAKEKAPYRIYSFKGVYELQPLTPSANLVFHIDSCGAYSPLVMKRYFDLMGKLGGVNDSQLIVDPDEEYLYRHLAFLGMLNVKYIVSSKTLDSRYLEKVFDGGSSKVYKNPLYMARVFLLERYVVEPDETVTLSRVQSDEFNPRAVVYLNREPVFAEGVAVSCEAETVTIVSLKPGMLELACDVGRNKILFWSDVYYPGWKAFVDGRPAEIYKANYIFKAVALGAGRHSVVFKFKPLESF